MARCGCGYPGNLTTPHNNLFWLPPPGTGTAVVTTAVSTGGQVTTTASQALPLLPPGTTEELLFSTFSDYGSGVDSTQDIFLPVSLSAFLSPSATTTDSTLAVTHTDSTTVTSTGSTAATPTDSTTVTPTDSIAVTSTGSKAATPTESKAVTLTESTASSISSIGETQSTSLGLELSTPPPSLPSRTLSTPNSVLSISYTHSQVPTSQTPTTKPPSTSSIVISNLSPSQTDITTPVVEDQVKLTFVFFAVVVFLVLLIGVALIVLFCLCFCRRQSKRVTVFTQRNGFGRGVIKEELPMVRPVYSSLKPLPPPIPERTEESQTIMFENVAHNLDSDCQPEELLAFDSLRPVPPPPAQVTPRSSIRVSVRISNTHTVNGDDYFSLEDATTGRFSDYREPQDSIGFPGPASRRAPGTGIDPYEDDIDGGDVSNCSPPPPVPPRGSSQVSTSSELSDSHDYDHIYREPLEPSMLAMPYSPSKDALPYAPIYSIPKGKSSTTFPISMNNIRLIQELGKGHFGKVHLAATTGVSLRDLKLSDDCNRHRSLLVAVKMLKAQPDRDLTEAFHKQISFMSRLKHANVIRLLATSAGESPFIVMEYMENGDLHEFLRKQRLKPETISALDTSEVTPMILFYIAVQIASGMHYLASKKFVHRDLATRNCLIGRDFVVKISDFGMSRNVYKTSYFPLTGQLILPIRWMATETFYGKFSVKSDAWAFGVTVWEVFTLCQSVPYSDMTDNEAIQDALKGEGRRLLSKPGACPAEVYQIMLRCFVFLPFMRADFEEIYSRLLMIYTKLSQQNA